MVELRPSKYLEVHQKYEDGCDRNCNECPAFAEKFQRCVFDAEKLWNKWTKERHQKLKKFMEEQDE